MRAVVRSQYGPPELISIQEVKKPVPKDNEILIQVFATTVSRTDCGILWGKPYAIRLFTGLFKPTSPTPGTDFAGQVEAIGKNVKLFKVGDRVFGLDDEGLVSHAEYMTIHENKAVAIPDTISYEQAAASAEGPHYAYNFITKVNLKPGHKVLVNGATGGIGSAALQLLKYFGLEVTAVGNTQNLELLKSLGAVRVIDFTKEDFTRDTEKYHFVFDAVGKSSYGRCKHLLLKGGAYVSSELGPGAENLYLPITTFLTRSSQRVIFPLPVNPKRSTLLMRKLLEEGKYTPVIDRTYAFAQIADAYTFVASGQKTGNVVIRMDHKL